VTSEVGRRLTTDGYVLTVEDTFAAEQLDERLWIPHYLPHWSSRSASAARYRVGGGALRLRIDADQQPWAPGVDGWLRVSSLQTGTFSGPAGSLVGQHRFRNGLRVAEAQPPDPRWLFERGLVRIRARAVADPANMVAGWLIGYEDEPERSAEICVFEIFGRDVGPHEVGVGMGIHPFGDPTIRDDFERVRLPIDGRQPHEYAAERTGESIAFYVDERLVRVVRQSPAYPMQLMLGIYELADGPEPASPPDAYPKEFIVESVRGYRPARPIEPAPRT
jgi:hypothetical protein